MTPWTIASQAPLSMGFSRQEYWSRLPFPSPRDLPNPGIKTRSNSRIEFSSLNVLNMRYSTICWTLCAQVFTLFLPGTKHHVCDSRLKSISTCDTQSEAEWNHRLQVMIIMCQCLFTMQHPRWLSGKESACNVGDLGSVPGLGKILLRRE